jgi:hypothetical protein
MPNRHPPRRARDLANGFILAEILSRYFPAEIAMHSFQNVTSTELRKANWKLLDKCLKVGGEMAGDRPQAPPYYLRADRGRR